MTNWQVIRDSMKKTGHCGYSPEDWRELRMLEAMRREHSKLGHNIQRGCDGLTAYEKCLECNYEYAVSVWNP